MSDQEVHLMAAYAVYPSLKGDKVMVPKGWLVKLKKHGKLGLFWSLAEQIWADNYL